MFVKPIAAAAALAALALTAGAFPAKATILVTASRANNFSTTTTPSLIPLSNSGATSIKFTTTKANTKIRIIYNAECGVLGASNTWLSVTVRVDGVEANPASGTDFAFCTATSTTNFTWIGATRQSIITVPAVGTHTLTVQGDLNFGATEMWLGDTSVVVDE
jgi:hypothetical protein